MSTKKRKSGMMVQRTGSTKMVKKEEKVLNADVRKHETNDWSSTKANADTNQRDLVPRRSIKIRSSQRNPPNSRIGRTKSSPQKEASARATKTSSSDVRVPLRNKELANLMVNINSGSVVTPKTTRSDRQIYASIKLEVPCDEDSLLIQPRKSTACLVKIKECNDNVSMLVHGDTTNQDPHKRRSLIEKHNEEIEVPSARTNRAKSVPRCIQAPSVENGVVSASNDIMDKASSIKTPSKNAQSRRETIESVQKEIVKAEPLKREIFECTASLVANPHTPPRVTPRRSSSVKIREKSVRKSIPTTPSMDDFVTTNDAAMHSTSAVEKSHKDTANRHRLTESSRKKDSCPSEEQIVPQGTGVSMSMSVWDEISSVSESDSSDNDRSSDEDFDPNIKRRKRRSIWDLDSETDNGNIDRILSDKNKKRKSGIPDGITASPATISNGSSSVAREISQANKSSTDHVATSYDQRRFKCDVCVNDLRRVIICGATNLLTQGRRREKPFACSTCYKCFSHSSARRTHERTHTGEKPYACSICNQRFRQSAHLRSHKLFHSGERPFDRSSRRRHELIHKGEKPYACSICNKRFRQNVHLRKHKLTHSGPSTEDLPDVTQDCMNQPLSKQKSNLPDNAGNQKIRYISKPIENIVEKMANRNPDTFHLVWSKKFSMELASAVSQSGRNCLLIVKKFKPASFPDVLNLSKMLHTFSIEIGSSAKPIRLFSFGGMVMPEKIIHNGGFKSLTKLESKLSKFARSQETRIVNIFKHSENNNGWYESLRSNLKEDCIITNKE